MIKPLPFENILKDVSRTFYLSVRFLPADIRRPVGLAFLLCKAGDTIADTRLLSTDRRLEFLEGYHTLFVDPNRALFIEPNLAMITGAKPAPDLLDDIAGEIRVEGGSSGERALMEHLPDIYRELQKASEKDRSLIRNVVASVTEGMTMDLKKFPREDSDTPQALLTRTGLDLYCYLVAGSVGEFWTQMMHEHRPALQSIDHSRHLIRAVRFGKGLQMTNILRDVAADLRRGRCYLPIEDLKPYGLTPKDLMNSEAIRSLRPVIRNLAQLTVGHLDNGLDYVTAIPRREWRIRLASLVPLLLAVDTLLLVVHSDRLLDPNAQVKVSRTDVRRILGASMPALFSDTAVRRAYGAKRSRLVRSLENRPD